MQVPARYPTPARAPHSSRRPGRASVQADCLISSKGRAGNKGSHTGIRMGNDPRAGLRGRSEVQFHGKQGRGESRYKDARLRWPPSGNRALNSLETPKELCEKRPRTAHLRVRMWTRVPVGCCPLSVKGGPMQFQDAHWLVSQPCSRSPRTGSETYVGQPRVRCSWRTSMKLLKACVPGCCPWLW